MKVATFGDINIDVVLDVDCLPEHGDEAFSTSRRELLGGSAVNTAVVLVRLGVESTVMGAVGNDDAGWRAMQDLGSAGVGIDLVTVSPTHPTAMNTVLVTPDGERTMIGARGANAHYSPPDAWHHGVGWLHVSGYSLMEGPQQQSAFQAITTAGEKDIPCSLDVPVGVGSRIRNSIPGLRDGFQVIAGSRRALSELTGSDDPLKALDGGPSRIAITSGADPLALVVGVERVDLTPPSVEAVDVTGAGDAFVAGLIAGTAFGLEPGPLAVFAAAAGAAATLVPGAAATLIDHEVWSDLLDDARWVDADPSWLVAVRSWVGLG